MTLAEFNALLRRIGLPQNLGLDIEILASMTEKQRRDRFLLLSNALDDNQLNHERKWEKIEQERGY